MAKDTVKFLSWPGSPIILVFDFKRQYQIARGTPSAEVLNTQGEIGDFRLKSLFISETVRL